MLCIIYLSYCFVIAVEFYKEEYPIDLNQWLDLHRMNMINNISFVVIKNVSLFDCRWKMHDREKNPQGDGNFKFLFSSSPTQLSGSNWVDSHLDIATAWRD